MTGEELEALVRDRWSGLLRTYRLSTSPDGTNRTYVSGEGVLLQVFATRDGVEITYIDQTKPTLPLYSIDSLLLRKRRDRLTFLPAEPHNTSFYDYVAIHLDLMAAHLAKAGLDVLRGERGWMAEHGPSRLDASPDMRAFLSGPHTFRPVQT